MKPFRSEKYRRYVASFPCSRCQIQGHSQCAHEEYGKGKGTKSDDRNSFPLCADFPLRFGCHSIHTLLKGMTRGQRRDMERVYVERMQAQAKRDGWDIFETKPN